MCFVAGLVRVLLVEDEEVLIFRAAVDLVEETLGLLPRERGELPDGVLDLLSLTLPGLLFCDHDERHLLSFPFYTGSHVYFYPRLSMSFRRWIAGRSCG